MKEKPSEWIAIADLMAGVVAVVMLMLVVAVLQIKAAQAKPDPPAKAPEPPKLDPDAHVRGILTGLASKSGKAGGLEVQVDQDNKILRLPNDVLFRSGDATPSDSQLKRLAILSRGIREGFACSIPSLAGKNQQCVQGAPKLAVVMIEGHADRQPILKGARYMDNLELSTARAAAVFRAMAPEFDGLLNSQRQPLLGAAGYGELRPRTAPYRPGASLDSPEDRRIEIRFVFEPS